MEPSISPARWGRKSSGDVSERVIENGERLHLHKWHFGTAAIAGWLVLGVLSIVALASDSLAASESPAGNVQFPEAVQKEAGSISDVFAGPVSTSAPVTDVPVGPDHVIGPTDYRLMPDTRVSDLIDATGGFGSIQLNPGDTVVVPRKMDKSFWLRTTKDITQIMFQIALTAGVILAL